MNTNLAHNILNIVIALLGVATAVLVATGCNTIANDGLDCSRSVVSPTYTGIAIAFLGGIKTAINIIRDGLAGLAKPQPPVSK